MSRHDNLVHDLVLKHGWNATSYQVLNPGIEHWISSDSACAVGFVDARRTLRGISRMRIAAGEPICDESRVSLYADAFEEAARDSGRSVCWFAADARLQDARQYDSNYCEMSLGAQPVWNPARWQDILASKSSLRAQLNRAQNKGVVVTKRKEHEKVTTLRTCLEEWLSTRGLPTLHFLVEPQALNVLYNRQIFIARRGNIPVAYLVLSPVPARSGWLVEQIVRGHNSPNGTAALLVDAAMRSAALSGASYLTLGLSPLSTFGNPSSPNPLWLHGLLGWMCVHTASVSTTFAGWKPSRQNFNRIGGTRLSPLATNGNQVQERSMRLLMRLADSYPRSS